MEEELQKRNTDCVYFLASPLTCKKGIECEYRHSDIARLNPRDCWYWLAGNCLNPTCAFRHPPLDGHSEASSESAAVPMHQIPIPTNKTDVPCFFYFNGFCNKGDHCSFSHGSDDSTPALKPVKVTSAVCDALQLDSKTAAGSDSKTLPIETDPSPSEKAAKAPPPHQIQHNEIFLKSVCNDVLKQSAPLQIPMSKGEETTADILESPLPAEVFAQSASLVCTDESSDGELDEHTEPEERWESSPGFDVLVDGTSDNVDYGDEPDYTVALDRKGGELNSDFMGYDFEGQFEYGPKHSEAEILYEHRRYDSFDFADYDRSSDYGMLGPILSRERKLSPFRFAEDHQRCLDLRDHLRKRRGFDCSSIDYFSRSQDTSHLICQTRQRSQRPSSGQMLHRKSTLEVGRNMIGSFTEKDFLLNGVNGKNWSRYTMLHRPRQRFGEKRRSKKLRLASRVSKEPATEERTSTQVSTSFTRPKTLAEIREEKRRARENGACVGIIENLSRIRSGDFQGPKPLSEILKEKRREVDSTMEGNTSRS